MEWAIVIAVLAVVLIFRRTVIKLLGSALGCGVIVTLVVLEVGFAVWALSQYYVWWPH